MNLIRIPIILLAFAFAFVACNDPTGAPSPGTTAAPEAKVSFVNDVKPLLEERCLGCHNTGTLLGHLNLETRKLAFEAGAAGPFIVPGKPQQSKLYTFTLITGDKPESMPPMKHKLSDAEKKLLRDWIAQGAEWPEGPEGTLQVIAEPTN